MARVGLHLLSAWRDQGHRARLVLERPLDLQQRVLALAIEAEAARGLGEAVDRAAIDEGFVVACRCAGGGCRGVAHQECRSRARHRYGRPLGRPRADLSETDL